MTQIAQYTTWTGVQNYTAAKVQQHAADGVTEYILGGFFAFPYVPSTSEARIAATKTFVDMAHAAGIKVSLGLKWASGVNASTPLAPWFEEVVSGHGGGLRWETDYTDTTNPLSPEQRVSVRTAVLSIGKVMLNTGADRLDTDGEEYNPNSRHLTWAKADRLSLTGSISDQYYGYVGTPSWHWKYMRDYAESANNAAYAHLDVPANGHTEAETRAQVKLRGQQFIGWLLEAWPNAKISANYNRLPGSAWMIIDERAVGVGNSAYRQSVIPDFWAGILSNPNLKGFRHHDRGFYRQHDPAMMESSRADLRSLYLGLVPDTRRKTLNDTTSIEPMVWLDTSPTAGEHAYVNDAEALAFMQDAGMGSEVTAIVYGRSFDTTIGYTGGGIWTAFRAAKALTPRGIPVYAAPETLGIYLMKDGVMQGSTSLTIA